MPSKDSVRAFAFAAANFPNHTLAIPQRSLLGRVLSRLLRCTPLWQKMRLTSLLVLVLIVLSTTGTDAFAVNDNFIYDELGRIVGMMTNDTAAVTYRYDAAGNIVAIRREKRVSIIEFTPNGGSVGTTVTLFGVGFSSTPSQNIVKFNGVAATVTESTGRKIVTQVPQGGTSGLISVTTPRGSATSVEPFVVNAEGADAIAPTVIDFNPKFGSPGTTVTIDGTSFQASPSDNQVRFNGATASTTTSSATRISTVLPTDATTGKIRVSTPYGTAVSSDEFFVVPAPLTATDISSTSRIDINGASSTVTISDLNKGALIYFNGSYGQFLGLGLSAMTLNGVTISVIKSDGQFADFTPGNSRVFLNSPGESVDIPRLSASGTYAILVRSHPATPSTGAVTLTLSADIESPLPTDGTTSTTTTTRIGQNIRFTLDGRAGRALGIDFPTTTIPSADATLQNFQTFEGNRVSGLASITSGATNAIRSVFLPADGVYHVFISPKGTVLGSISARTAIPDLILKTVSVPSTPLAPNTDGSYRFPVSWIVDSVGTQNALPPWSDTLYLSRDTVLNVGGVGFDPSINGTALMRTTTVSVGTGYTGTDTVRTPANTAPGTYYVIAAIDAANALAESDENNNVKASATTITLGGRPDLTTTAFSIATNAAVGPNTNGSYSIPVSWTVANVGTNEALPSWSDAFFLSTDTLFDTGDVYLGAVARTTALPAGTSYSASGTAVAPTVTSPGTYYIIGVADFLNRNSTLFETDETNNAKVSATTVTLGPRPDLTPTAINGPATAVGSNNNGSYTIAVSFTVDNLGPGEARAGWADQVFISTDNGNSTSGPSLGLFQRGTPVGPRTSYTGTVTGVTTTSIAPGSYSLVVKVDPSNVLAETDDSNNAKVSATQVTLKARPDLTVSALTIPTAQVARSANGTYVIPITATVSNATGVSDVQPTWFDQVYISSDNVLGLGDSLIAGVSRNTALAAGTSYTAIASGTANVVAGSYYIIYVADGNRTPGPEGYVKEGDENNNVRVSATQVTLSP